MDNNKLLHLFSKDTDAYASQRGYNYQTLLTLETWVNNYLNEIDENIYCEFEEDIFQKNDLLKTAKFRQIKLYSSNFSFKSIEVQKCIYNFFMIHFISDYSNYEKEFVFETNTSIARQYLENDADILKDWYENQEEIPEEKLEVYSKKVKEIVEVSINSNSSFSTNISEEESEDAKEIILNFDDSFWKEFVKMIKWKFLGIEPEIEFKNTKERIELLIVQLPFKEIVSDKLQESFSVLLEKVFTTSTNRESRDRKLTNSDLERLILSIGNENDKWYSDRYEIYKAFETIQEFRIGEFYEIIDLVNYCRRKTYLHIHKDKWNRLLDFYINNENINSIFKRKAIYESVFLNLQFSEIDYSNLENFAPPLGNLVGLEDMIIFYFEDFKEFFDSNELEKAQNILNLIIPQILDEETSLTEEMFSGWVVNLYRELCSRLNKEKNINEKCILLEQKGNFLFMANSFRKKNRLEFIKCYNEILDNIDDAPLFQIIRFGDRINKYIKISINFDPIDEYGVIEAFEKFSVSLFIYVEKREGKLQLAKQQIERGTLFFEKRENSLMLKALDYFHKAKLNYQQGESMEGYTLVLLNIGQLYMSLGMYFAAKYYLLGSFRIGFNEELMNRVSDSLSLLFGCDFKSGGWFNAFYIFDRYTLLRNDFVFDEEDYETEAKTIFYLGLMLYTLKTKFHQFNYFVQYYSDTLNSFFEEDVTNSLFSEFENSFNNDEKLNKRLLPEIDDHPINDVSKQREINFNALGSLWKFNFKNDSEVNAIAEEFIANCQIVFSEIALSKMDFHLLKTEISINLELSSESKPPVEIPSNNILKRKVFVTFLETTDNEKLNYHSVLNTNALSYILSSLSLLSETDFYEKFIALIKERELNFKQISVNLYQRIHRDVYDSEQFDLYQKTAFEKENFNFNFLKNNDFMKWNDLTSSLYDKSKSLEAIKNRYNNAKKCIYLTLDNLKENSRFKEIINNYRLEGWTDWQITTNILNFIINSKANFFDKKELSNPTEDTAIIYRKLFAKYLSMDEKDCFLEFSAESFESDDFKLQFDINLAGVLNSYGLQAKLGTPQFGAIRELLNIKFDFDKDEVEEENLLKDIR